LEQYRTFDYTVIFYESCHRIQQTLQDILSILGSQRVITVARELTKLHETFAVGTTETVAAAVNSQPIRGEYVILIAPERFQL
jgi:16S rRNA (cytidine1402-2'-O)-methyltransferase